jgi:hypothetical protein
MPVLTVDKAKRRAAATLYKSAEKMLPSKRDAAYRALFVFH